MKTKSIYIFLLLLAGLINFYCSSAEKFLSNRSIPVGGEASFTLQTDRRGGYEWEVGQNSDPAVLGYVSKDYIDNPDGLGSEVFKFKGLKKGTVEIILNYVNKSASAGKVYKTQTYSVTVR
jgi:hypothetical protein